MRNQNCHCSRSDPITEDYGKRSIFAANRPYWPHDFRAGNDREIGGALHPVKFCTKLVHSAWAGYWSFVMVRFSAREFYWSEIQTEPQIVLLPVLACLWLPFALGLWFDRRWAWIGSFMFCVLSLFVAFYIAWGSVAIANDEGWQNRQLIEFVWIVPAVIVVAMLLHARRHFFRASPEGLR